MDDLKTKCQSELESAVLVGKRDKISKELLSYKLKNYHNKVITNPSEDLNKLVKLASE